MWGVTVYNHFGKFWHTFQWSKLRFHQLKMSWFVLLFPERGEVRMHNQNVSILSFELQCTPMNQSYYVHRVSRVNQQHPTFIASSHVSVKWILTCGWKWLSIGQLSSRADGTWRISQVIIIIHTNDMFFWDCLFFAQCNRFLNTMHMTSLAGTLPSNWDWVLNESHCWLHLDTQ